MSSHDAADGDPNEMPSPLSFVELMALERLDDTKSHANPNEPEKVERFRSLSAPYPPGESDRAFGGHAYAQSAYAASKTVEKGFVIYVSPMELYALEINLNNSSTGYGRLIHPRWSARCPVHIHGSTCTGWIHVLHALC